MIKTAQRILAILFLSIGVSGMTAHAGDTVFICEALIETQQGAVSGFDTVKKGSEACVYKGIPYAKAPVGELRWQPPQDAQVRTSLLRAKHFGADCMQSRRLNDMAVTSLASETGEDCLYLNIWRPKKAGTYPVMVWVHGGALLIGSAAWPIYDGTVLAGKHEVVLVTINYRLGAFGYLAHPALEDKDDGFRGGATGNYGLLDQQKALQWVKDNIGGFSGDANNITVFGESAGGWSVFSLLVSPFSEGLFHKAIAQSGSSEASNNTHRAFTIGERFAKKLDCKEGDVATCLREVPAQKISNKSLTANMRCTLSPNIGHNLCWMPREDGVLLPDKGMHMIRSGAQHKVPIMAGHTSKDPWFLKKSTINSMTLMQEQPNWLYEFKFKKHSLNIVSSGVHGTELPFVFDTMTDSRLFYDLIPFYREKHERRGRHLIDAMQSYWTNFARYGDPNGVEQRADLLHWPQHNGEQYLYLSNEIKVKSR